jgi:drug/metabolite transporter (DMT)-like permease
VIILNEPLTPWNVAGLALILCGSVLATRRTDADPVPVTPEPTGVGPR